MRALQLTAPGQVETQVAPDPVAGEHEVLVRIQACGLCGSDLNAWRGVPGTEYPLPPGAPGHEARGQVIAVGPRVDGLTIGQTVTGLLPNGLAELSAGREEDLVVVPPNYPHLLGEPLACAMNVVRRAAIAPGDRVAIVGFGYLAALVVQLLPAHVAGWVAISRRADSRALATKLGAAVTYDFDAVPGEVWDHFPVVIEAAGVQQALDYATWLTAYGGRLIVAGYHADGPRTVNMQSWNWKGIDVINAHERQPAIIMQGLRTACALLAERTLDLDDLHTHELPLSEAAEAFRLLSQRPSGFFKAVVCP